MTAKKVTHPGLIKKPDIFDDRFILHEGSEWEEQEASRHWQTALRELAAVEAQARSMAAKLWALKDERWEVQAYGVRVHTEGGGIAYNARRVEESCIKLDGVLNGWAHRRALVAKEEG